MPFNKKEPLYTELPGHDTHQGQLPASQTVRRRNPVLVIITCFLILFLAGFWSVKRMRGVDEFEDDGSKGIVVASYSAQDVSWIPAIPSECVDLGPGFGPLK